MGGSVYYGSLSRGVLNNIFGNWFVKAEQQMCRFIRRWHLMEGRTSPGAPYRDRGRSAWDNGGPIFHVKIMPLNLSAPTYCPRGFLPQDQIRFIKLFNMITYHALTVSYLQSDYYETQTNTFRIPTRTRTKLIWKCTLLTLHFPCFDLII